MSQGFLNIVVDRLIEEIGIKVFDKYKFEDDDGVVMDGGKKLFCNIFNIFRRDNWFDVWVLKVGMKMSDKPSFVRYGYSVLLD